MSVYSVALYLHIIGAVGMFAGLGMEGIVYSNLRNAVKASQVFPWGSAMKMLRIVFGVSMLLLLIPGIYLVIETWGWTSWVIIGLVLLAALSGFGSTTGKKIGMTIGSLQGKADTLTDDVKKILSTPMKSYRLKITLALGIIFIMTVKPDWTVSIISIAVAFAAGFLISNSPKQKETAKELESA
jgi:hypothetical protein